MVVCFILISTKPAREHLVYDDLLKIKELDRVQPLFGEWDLFVEANVSNLGDVRPLEERIKSNSNVIDTKVLTGMEF